MFRDKTVFFDELLGTFSGLFLRYLG